ncbi:oligopeptide transport system permease protein [Sporobacter termitidis DSM 10068]|uniref:Oligopeptide transport system permease protein n=1 Tax=Sporobacter termitidis DSM 10068 TaxID=1123282 RepID=A0A1M5U4V9_9FIRM|nr:ABC transporter permease [Sporobacter termitidis]SHH58057.1 oligopeptide transport system permease protein [Sporobacter termitidis DSM 10068]
MAKYIIKRVILAVVTVFVVATITFFLMNLVPGGPFITEKSISVQAQEALKEKFGLDKPLIVQYKNYMLSILQGDFGLSLRQRGRTVSDIIGSRFPISARLGGISMVVAVVIGVPLGSVAALNRGKWGDKVITVIATCGAAFPSFVICTVGMYIFGVHLGWLPTMGLTAPANYILPVFALSFYPMAYITRLMRSSMLDVIGQDYMRTARAKGLSQANRLFRQALRNAILPVITYVGPMLAYLLAGTFVVEKIFVIPGLGGQFVSSILNRDYTVIMGTTIFLATLVIVINALVDIAYKFIDPRVQLK